MEINGVVKTVVCCDDGLSLAPYGFPLPPPPPPLNIGHISWIMSRRYCFDIELVS